MVLLRDLSQFLRFKRSDVAHSAHRDGLRGAWRARASQLLFFAQYLLFSIIAVSYPYHDHSPGKKCNFCFMGNSLSSTLACKMALSAIIPYAGKTSVEQKASRTLTKGGTVR